MSFVTIRNSRAALRRLARDRSGASALEMALVMPVLFLIMIGVIEIARYVFTLQSLRSVTAEAARLSMINSATKNTGVVISGGLITSCTASSAINVAATQKTPFIDNTTLTLCISNTTSSGQVTILVSAQYPFNSFLPRTSFLTTTLTDNTQIIYRNN